MSDKKGIIPKTPKQKDKEAPKPGSSNFIDLSTYVKEIRGIYKEDLAQGTFNCLLLGAVGSGKTNMLGTCRKPVLIHSFDPGGTKTLKNWVDPLQDKPNPRDLIASGEVIPDTRYEGDDSKNPQAWRIWQREFEKLRRANFFEQVGTFSIDSFTTWLTALKYHILKKQGRQDGIMTRHDWQVLGNTIRDTLNVITALPCDVVLTGHLTTQKDDVSGRIQTRLEAIPSLQNELPMLFDEIYCLEANETSKGIDVRVVTRNTGKYNARTRVGSGIFDTKETPHFKELLKKAGYPYKDKTLPEQEQQAV